MSGGKEVDNVLAALRETASSKHSKLYLWLLRHYASVASGIDEHGANWTALAEAFGKLGLTDRKGQLPSPSATKRTYYRVRASLAGKPKTIRRKPDSIPDPADIRLHTAHPDPPKPPQPPSDAPETGESDPLAEARARMNKRFGRTP